MRSRRPIARLNRGRVLRRAEVAPPAPDVTAPTLVSATIPANGLSIVLVYDEALDAGSIPDAGDYALDGTASAVDSVGVLGDTVTLTLDAAVFDGETITLDYTPGASHVQDAAGNDADALAAEPVTNGSTVLSDVTPPTLSTAILPSAGTTLVLTYNEALDAGSTPAAGAYSLGGTARTVSSVGIVGSAVTLTLSGAVAQGATVTVSYTAGGSPVQDAAGNDAANLVAQAVTNNSTSDQTAPQLDGNPEVPTDGAYLALFFNEDMDQTSTPAAGSFSLAGTHATITSTAWVDDREFRLVFTTGSRITDFETVTLNYTAGANPLRDVALNSLGNLSSQATTNNSTFLQGAVLVVNAYRAASYVLSGSNVTHVTNEATGTSHATTGSPQYLATGLNSRPAIDFDGTDDQIEFADSAIINAQVNQAAMHLFVVAQWDSDDAAYALLSVGTPGSSQGRAMCGLSSNAAGRHSREGTSDGNVVVNPFGVDGAPDTSPHVYEWHGSTTVTMRRDAAIDGSTPGGDLNARPWNIGTIAAATRSYIGVYPGGTPGRRLNGQLSYMVLFPSELSSSAAAEVRAYLSFLAGLP